MTFPGPVPTTTGAGPEANHAVVSGPEFTRGVGLVVDATDLHHEYSHDLTVHIFTKPDIALHWVEGESEA